MTGAGRDMHGEGDPVEEDLRSRLAAAEEENAEVRRHLKLLLDGTMIVVAACRRGGRLERVFLEALESAVAQAGAFVIARRRATRAALRSGVQCGRADASAPRRMRGGRAC